MDDKDGDPIRKNAFKYYTTLSNIFSAVGCGVFLFFEVKNCVMCGQNVPHWAVVLKYFGLVTVTLTFLMVLFYLAPTRGFGKLYGGSSFFTHCLGPLLAFISFCFLEDFDRISVEEAFVALVPSLAYYMVYLRNVLLVAERDAEGNLIKGWDDLYGFNRSGKWPFILVLMLGIIVIIALVLRIIYNS